MDNANVGYIETHTSYFPLAFLFHFFKTLMVIDGADQGKVPWGTQRFPVAPGRHHVKISARYFFFTSMMANETVVDVWAGTAVRVKYRAPWLVFLKGKITVEQVPGAPGPAPGPALSPGPGAFPSAAPVLQQPPQQPPQQPAQPPARPAYPGSVTTVLSTLPPIPTSVPTPQGAPAAPHVAAAAPEAAPAVPEAAPASAPGAWHPDPTGRHQQRYWDGARWSEHVSDDGQTSSDPL